MSVTNIQTKQVVNPERVNRARDISGLNKWSRESKAMGFIMLVLGWFTIPAEVFLRHDFGRRWFTIGNYLSGFLLLFAVALIEGVYELGAYFFTHLNSVWNPFYTEEATETLYAGAYYIGPVGDFYLLIGLFHLFKIWWRSRTNNEIHSYDDGKSWFEIIGFPLMWLINLMAAPIIYIGMLFLSEEQQKGTKQPWLFTDRRAFTNIFVEPVLLLYAAMIVPHVVESMWLYITAFAVAIQAAQKESVKVNKVLDLKDSALEAKAMRELQKQKFEQQSKAKKPDDIKTKTPQSNKDTVVISYPDVMTIAEQMYKERALKKIITSLRS